MISAALAFLLGIASLQFLMYLPHLMGLVLASLSVAGCWSVCDSRNCKRVLWILGFLLLGMFWAELRIIWVKSWSLDKALENKVVMAIGRIASLPKLERDYASFNFALQTLDQQPTQSLVKLVWYQPYPQLHVGDQWRVHVSLKRPHALINPGGFDYEKWLFANNIRATGHVLAHQPYQLLSSDKWVGGIDRAREYLLLKIQQSLSPTQPMLGFIQALTVGVQNQISPEQWRVLRATGTNHLMAIAGVHMGFISGFIYFISHFFWRRFPRWVLWLPASQAAAILALLACGVYSALAGFSLPTQRSLIMMSVFLLSLLLRRCIWSWQAFFLALWMILLWDPLATLSVSFWLSFGAVAAILYGAGGRLHARGFYWQWVRIPWVTGLALIPLSIGLFQQSSWISLIANMVAVPAVGFLVLPLCLLGMISMSVSFTLATYLLWLAAKIMAGVWWFLEQLAHVPGAVWQQVMPNVWIGMAAVVGVTLLLAPRGLPLSWIGCIWCFPLLFYKPASPELGEVWFSLLDVGQGLSAVVQTAHHVLIFDAGPKMGEFDAGESVILPFLLTAGIKRVDTLLISHGDNDHRGGAAVILNQLAVGHILTSVPKWFPSEKTTICQPGQSWEWDKVKFKVLYPPLELLTKESNDSSCVLRIDNGRHSILLTGDIEKKAETYLLEHEAKSLPAELLVVPHHGSKTSSLAEFVQQVRPQYAFFALGYLNRYRFPAKAVVVRYQQIGAQLYDTANSGAVLVKLGQNSTITLTEQRKTSRFWR